jgi:hypothetical protein
LESEDEDSSWVSLGKRSASSVLYFITDNERFAPPKKRSKVVKKERQQFTSPHGSYSHDIGNGKYKNRIFIALCAEFEDFVRSDFPARKAYPISFVMLLYLLI